MDGLFVPYGGEGEVWMICGICLDDMYMYMIEYVQYHE